MFHKKQELLTKRKSGEVSCFIGFSALYIRDYSLVYDLTIPATLDVSRTEPHTANGYIPDIIGILLTAKIPAYEIIEYYGNTYTVVALQYDFAVLSDFIHNCKTCF